jgi:hypothetical protein
VNFIKYSCCSLQLLDLDVQFKDIHANVINKFIKVWKDFYVGIVRNMLLYLIKSCLIGSMLLVITRRIIKSTIINTIHKGDQLNLLKFIYSQIRNN